MTRFNFAFILLLVSGCTSEVPDEEITAKGMNTKWKCSHCDEWHTDLPFAYGPNYPDIYFSIPNEERESRVIVDKDFCVIDNEHFFVRGQLKIPVIDSEETFSWDVWVSLSESNFKRSLDLLETEGRESENPYFGWLCNNLHVYPDTTHLKTDVHTQPVGTVPSIELEPTDHPLAVEQREGINLVRVKEIAEQILHPKDK